MKVMKASLDTNAIIHFYRAGLQKILFDFFPDGLIIYEQIRNIELENHGQDVLEKVDCDIKQGKIEVYTEQKLKELHIHKIFKNNVNENKYLFQPGDLGEVYAISLAQTIGAYSLVTDDTKPGGPYMSLLTLKYEVVPFNFCDILILRYLQGSADERKTIRDFDSINTSSELAWSLRGRIRRFIKRFVNDPYKEEDKEWMNRIAEEKGIDVIAKLRLLDKLA